MALCLDRIRSAVGHIVAIMGVLVLTVTLLEAGQVMVTHK